MYKLYKDRNGKLLDMELQEDSDRQNKSSDNIDYSSDAYRGKVETLNTEILQLRNEIQQVTDWVANYICNDLSSMFTQIKHPSHNGISTIHSTDETDT